MSSILFETRWPRSILLVLLASVLACESNAAVKIEVQTTTHTSTPATPGGDGALLFAERVADVTNRRIRLTIQEPETLVPTDAMLEAVSRGSKDGGIDAAIIVPTQNKVIVGGSFVSLPFTSIYLSGIPFGPEAEEFLSWMYEGGGLALENSLYNARLSGGDGVVVMPMGMYHGDGSGMTPEEIPSTTAELAAKPWNLRILGLGGKVIQKAIDKVSGSPQLTIHPGTVNLPVYDDLFNGILQASEFGSPARDLYEFFDKPVAGGNLPVSHLANPGNSNVVPLPYYHLGAWHQPFILFEFVINKQVYEKLGTRLQEQLENAARAHVLSELVRTDKASGEALVKMQNTYDVTVVKGWPAAVLDDFRAATIEVINQEAADPDFNSVLISLREFTRTQQFYWKFNNVKPAKRFDTGAANPSTWPGWESDVP